MIDPHINADNQEFYDDLKRRVLRSWDGDQIKVTGTRKSDGATIYTVYHKGHLVIRGTLFELEERARINERRKRATTKK